MSGEEVRVFNKALYEADPLVEVRQAIEKLASLGPAVVAVRGPGFSANLLGTIYVGKDGDDPVLRVDGCDCHVHLMWDKLQGYRLARENVGYGAEPVVYLTDESGDPIVNLFFPEKSYEEVEAALA